VLARSKQVASLAAETRGHHGDHQRNGDAWEEERAILLANIHSLQTLLAETHRARTPAEVCCWYYCIGVYTLLNYCHICFCDLHLLFFVLMGLFVCLRS
jgi:hypothetical protein